MTQTGSLGLLSRAKEEIQPSNLLPGLITGAVLGVTEIVFSLSLGSLVFSGELSPYLSYGIGIALATSVIMLVVISLTSGVPGVIGSTQDTTAVILAVITATLFARLSNITPDQRLTTILVVIALTPLLTGVFYLALGYFSWANWCVSFPIRSWVASSQVRVGCWSRVLSV